MSRSSIWVDLTPLKATGTVCERTPPASVAAALEADHPQFETTDEVKTAIVDSWEDVESEFLKNLVNSPLNRLFDVVSKPGGPIAC
ncbi:hypothetical protein ANCDUO_14566 [Ancylostoma duodenale]|uniref:Uncharacterized protein n=1 Tax=Ancylostoma duodenale TaxID=51022 RepID=A0A0C2GDX0_9BILA|nr:hypothetical protein ANCDUO_14566 [Ancylostoma duodenale]